MSNKHLRPMTFDDFQTLNARRCAEAFDPALHSVEFFAIAIAGEVGEMANELKKVLRGDYPLAGAARQKILNELADVITYSDLMISKLDANTENVIMEKFDEVSRRRGWKA